VRRSDKPASQNRIDVIDAFRAIAILTVLLFHYTFRWGPMNDAGQQDFYHYPVNVNWFQYGWLGVDLFFVISGFVIFMTILKCRSIYDFAFRRIARLYPVYLVCMTITFVLMRLWGPAEFQATNMDYLIGLTMQSANFGIHWVDGAYWSLLVEAKFYFWIGIVYFLARRHFVPVWCLLMVAVTAVREIHPFLVDGIFSATNLPFFTAGIGFFMLYRDKRLDRQSILLFVVSAVTYAVTWRHFPLVVHGYVAGIVVMFSLFVTGKLDWLRQDWLLFIGAISYPLYLLHQFIGVTMIVHGGARTVPTEIAIVLAVVAVVVALAWLVHKYVEVPIHELAHASIRRWQAARS
jgi:peptidoglycan/LPS O-acetylase OafA/YrhL